MRLPFLVAGLVFLLTVALVVVGLSANAPAALIPALLCGIPIFVFALGFGIGRVADQFQLVRRDVIKEPARRRDTPPAAPRHPNNTPTPLG